MKQLLFLFACLAPAFGVAAQEQEPAQETAAEAETPPAIDVEATHDEIRALRDRALEALNKVDLDALMSELHDDVVFTAMNAEVCRGKDEIRAYFEKMMVGPERIVESIQVDLAVDSLTILHGDDAGIAYGSSRDQYRLTSGTEFDVESRWSSTLVRDGGRWWIAGFHSSTNVFDNPLLAKARWLVYPAAGIAAIVALLVGVLIGRRRKPADGAGEGGAREG